MAFKLCNVMAFNLSIYSFQLIVNNSTILKSRAAAIVNSKSPDAIINFIFIPGYTSIFPVSPTTSPPAVSVTISATAPTLPIIKSVPRVIGKHWRGILLVETKVRVSPNDNRDSSLTGPLILW